MIEKYDVILADPPWSFKVWNKDTGSGRSASAHYPTMELEDICKFEVPAADNCALFMWACWPSLPGAFRVIEAWGFEYKTLGFEWWKLNKNWPNQFIPMVQVVDGYSWLERLFFFGMGYYARTNSEPCLLAVRGKMPVAVHDERNFIISPVREHSRKPDEQYGKIERLYPGKKYLELFARQKRTGWDAFGDEIESDVELVQPAPK